MIKGIRMKTYTSVTQFMLIFQTFLYFFAFFLLKIGFFHLVKPLQIRQLKQSEKKKHPQPMHRVKAATCEEGSQVKKVEKYC